MKTQEIDPELFITDKDTEQPAALTVKEPSIMSMIEYCLKNQGSVDIMERLIAMRDRDRSYTAKQAFDAAMEAAQAQVKTVIPDTMNEQTKKKYASFKALDNEIRPICKDNGLTLSFNSGLSTNPDEILVFCKVSHTKGHTEVYTVPMSTNMSGPKGGGVMSKPLSIVAATSYGRTTLLKLIFNIPIGEEAAGLDDLSERLEFIRQFTAKAELQKYYKAAAAEAFNINDFAAMKALTKAKNDRMAELEGK